MSMTLWVHILEGRQLTSHQDDHTQMQKFTPALDTLCAKICVPPISSFIDYTDAKANMSEFDDAAEDAGGSDEIDPETGWSYGIDDMTWFPATEGLVTLAALRTKLVSSDAEGGKETEWDDTYGKVRSLDPDAVRAVADALSKISVAELRARFSVAAFNAAKIYPHGRRARWTAAEAESVFDIYPRVLEFFQVAAQAGDVVLLSSA